MRCFVMMTLNVSSSFHKNKKKDERYAFCFVEGWDMRFTSREHFTWVELTYLIFFLFRRIDSI